MVDRRETDRPNNWKLPAVDETSRADGKRWGGTLSYWTGEAVQPQGSLPGLKMLAFSAHTLIALCTATGELVSDVPLLDAISGGRSRARPRSARSHHPARDQGWRAARDLQRPRDHRRPE